MSPSMIMPIPLGFWVFLQYSVFWVKLNGITIFRGNIAAKISLIALVFALWTGLSSLWTYFLLIYKLKRKGGYQTIGEANKKLKYLRVSGSKKRRAAVFFTMIFFPAFGIYTSILILASIGLVDSAVVYLLLFFIFSLPFFRIAIEEVIK